MGACPDRRATGQDGTLPLTPPELACRGQSPREAGLARGSGQTSAPRASSPPLRTGAAHHRQVSTEPRQGRHAHWSAGAPRPRAVARHKIRGPPCCSPGSGRESTHTTRVSTRRKGHAGARGPGPLHLETRTASGCHGSPASPASPLSGCLQPHGPCLGAGRGVVQARPAQRRARGTERGPGILLPRPRARKMDPQGRLPAPQHGNKVPHGGTFRPTGATCATPPTRPGNPNPWHLLCLRTSARTHRPCGNPLSSFVLSLSLSPSRSHPLSPFPWRARAHRSFLSFAGPIRRTISHLPSQESVRASRLSRNPSTGALTPPCPDEG